MRITFLSHTDKYDKLFRNHVLKCGWLCRFVCLHLRSLTQKQFIYYIREYVVILLLGKVLKLVFITSKLLNIFFVSYTPGGTYLRNDSIGNMYNTFGVIHDNKSDQGIYCLCA